MKSYEIWSEGFLLNSDEPVPYYHGSAKGEDFQDAVNNFAAANPNFDKFYSRKDLKYYGFKLYDNEADVKDGMNNAFQIYLRDCECEAPGIIMVDGTPVCRWCRKSYAKGAMINYTSEQASRGLK